MSDWNLSGPEQETPGITNAAMVLPLPPLNDEGVLAAHSYLVEIGEAEPGEPPTGVEELQALCYRLTVELARTRSLLRMERTFTTDALDEVEELSEQVEHLEMLTGQDSYFITELQVRAERAEAMLDEAMSHLDWDSFLASN